MNDYFLFCHGWGVDHKFFDTLIHKYFLTHAHYCLNLGYFKEENRHLPKHSGSIGIGHSLGLIKLASLPIKFKALIGIQSFINFLGFDLQLRTKRALALKTMARSFQTHPIETLHTFYKRCGIHLNDYVTFNYNSMNKGKLMEDLSLLMETHELPDLPLLIIGATDDPIVPTELIYDNFNKDVKIVIHCKGEHGLGLREPHFVYEQIINFLNEINGTTKGVHKG